MEEDQCEVAGDEVESRPAEKSGRGPECCREGRSMVQSQPEKEIGERDHAWGRSSGGSRSEKGIGQPKKKIGWGGSDLKFGDGGQPKEGDHERGITGEEIASEWGGDQERRWHGVAVEEFANEPGKELA